MHFLRSCNLTLWNKENTSTRVINRNRLLRYPTNFTYVTICADCPRGGDEFVISKRSATEFVNKHKCH